VGLKIILIKQNISPYGFFASKIPVKPLETRHAVKDQSVFDFLDRNRLQLTPVKITSLSLTAPKLQAKATALKKDRD